MLFRTTWCATLAVLGALLAFPASAYTTSALGKITRVESLTTAAQGFYIRFEFTIPNPAGCTNATDARIEKSQHPDAERMFVMALAAYSSGKKVVIGVDDTTCSGNYPKLVYIRMQES